MRVMNKNIVFLVLAALAFLPIACDSISEEFDFGEKATGDFEFEVFEFNPLIVTFNPVDVDTANALVAWDFGFTGSAGASAQLSPLVEFPSSGTYTVTMVLTNDAGITSIPKEITLEEPVGEVLPLEYFFLTDRDNPEGKTWVIDKDTDGHSGAGRGSSDNPDIWQRPAGALACLGLYNDEYTFKPDLSFAYNTGGDIYTRGGFQNNFDNPVNQSQICDTSLGLSGNDYRADYTAPSGLTWKVTKKEDGSKVLTLSDGSYIGMAVGQTEYELQVLNDDEMYVRFLQAGGSVSWYKRLIPKE